MMKDPPDADLSVFRGPWAAGGFPSELGELFECFVQGLLLANDACVADFGMPREAAASGGAARLRTAARRLPIEVFIPYLGPNGPASPPFPHENASDAERQRSRRIYVMTAPELSEFVETEKISLLESIRVTS